MCDAQGNTCPKECLTDGEDSRAKVGVQKRQFDDHIWTRILETRRVRSRARSMGITSLTTCTQGGDEVHVFVKAA